MFILLTIKDTLRVKPSDLGNLETNLIGTLRNCITAKYANRVIPKQGLVICLHSVLEHKSPTLYAGDGGAYIRAIFRLIVFQPFESEVLVGTLTASSPKGLVLSVGFFHYVYVPARLLPEDCVFDETENIWIWNCGDVKYYLETGVFYRFRVEEVRYPAIGSSILGSTSPDPLTGPLSNDVNASGQHSMSLATRAKLHGYEVDVAAALQEARRQNEKKSGGLGGGAQGQGESSDEPDYVQPLQIIAAINESGLGPLAWWSGDDDEPAEEQVEAGEGGEGERIEGSVEMGDGRETE